MTHHVGLSNVSTSRVFIDVLYFIIYTNKVRLDRRVISLVLVDESRYVRYSTLNEDKMIEWYYKKGSNLRGVLV